MKNILILAILLLLPLSQSFAQRTQNKIGLLPKNNMWITPHDKSATEMTQEKFNAIIDKVGDVYVPIVKEKGATLQINKFWDDGTVNADTDRITPGVWDVNVYGGLARHEYMTEEALLLAVCHELGHHVGGAPKYKRNKSLAWAANEGQSDYFASLKCMRRVLEHDDNVAFIANMTIDKIVIEQCELVYKSVSEIALCKRIAMAGKDLAILMGRLMASSVSFDSPDTSIVKKTDEDHPHAQCRLDTFFSGILCDKPFAEDISETDPTVGTCNKTDGYTTGTRPLCWFKR